MYQCFNCEQRLSTVLLSRNTCQMHNKTQRADNFIKKMANLMQILFSVKHTQKIKESKT